MSNPWMKFYPSDWRADPRLRMCSLAARGLWVEMLALMHEASPYGHCLVNGLPPNEMQLAVLAGAPSDQVPDLIGELEAAGVFSRTREGVIYSRRMTRDDKKSRTARKNGKKGGNPTLGKETLFPSSDKQMHKGEDKTQKPEARGQKEPQTPYGVEEAVHDWNRMAERCDLPKCKAVTKTRKSAIGTRLRDHGEKGWKQVIEFISKSPHHLGQNDREWKAGIDFAARESAFVGILERCEDTAIAAPETPEAWARRVKFFQTEGEWHAPGPKPNEPGCQAPPEVLERAGYPQLIQGALV